MRHYRVLVSFDPGTGTERRVAVQEPYPALEQTQEFDYDTLAQAGVYRIIDDECVRAPDLSERYPSIPIDMTRRQAC